MHIFTINYHSLPYLFVGDSDSFEVFFGKFGEDVVYYFPTMICRRPINFSLYSIPPSIFRNFSIKTPSCLLFFVLLYYNALS